MSGFNISQPSSYGSIKHTKPIGKLKPYSGYGGIEKAGVEVEL
jgi:hypothetical protein